MAVLDTVLNTPKDRRFLTDDIVQGKLIATGYSPHGSPTSFEYYHIKAVPDQKSL